MNIFPFSSCSLHARPLGHIGLGAYAPTNSTCRVPKLIHLCCQPIVTHLARSVSRADLVDLIYAVDEERSPHLGKDLMYILDWVEKRINRQDVRYLSRHILRDAAMIQVRPIRDTSIENLPWPTTPASGHGSESDEYDEHTQSFPSAKRRRTVSKPRTWQTQCSNSSDVAAIHDPNAAMFKVSLYVRQLVQSRVRRGKIATFTEVFELFVRQLLGRRLFRYLLDEQTKTLIKMLRERFANTDCFCETLERMEEVYEFREEYQHNPHFYLQHLLFSLALLFFKIPYMTRFLRALCMSDYRYFCIVQENSPVLLSSQFMCTPSIWRVHNVFGATVGSGVVELPHERWQKDTIKFFLTLAEESDDILKKEQQPVVGHHFEQLVQVRKVVERKTLQFMDARKKNRISLDVINKGRQQVWTEIHTAKQSTRKASRKRASSSNMEYLHKRFEQLRVQTESCVAKDNLFSANDYRLMDVYMSFDDNMPSEPDEQVTLFWTRHARFLSLNGSNVSPCYLNTRLAREAEHVFHNLRVLEIVDNHMVTDDALRAIMWRISTLDCLTLQNCPLLHEEPVHYLYTKYSECNMPGVRSIVAEMRGRGYCCPRHLSLIDCEQMLVTIDMLPANCLRTLKLRDVGTLQCCRTPTDGYQHARTCTANRVVFPFLETLLIDRFERFSPKAELPLLRTLGVREIRKTDFPIWEFEHKNTCNIDTLYIFSENNRPETDQLTMRACLDEWSALSSIVFDTTRGVPNYTHAGNDNEEMFYREVSRHTETDVLKRLLRPCDFNEYQKYYNIPFMFLFEEEEK